MKNTRLYHTETLTTDSEILLSEAALQHANVLKLKVDQTITLFNGHGGEYSGTIKQINHKCGRIYIEQFHDVDLESPLDIHLVQGISRGHKMDYTIQKSVELGVRSVLPVLCHRSVVKLDQDKAKKKQQHWQAVAISACEQCGRNIIPTIHPPQELSIWAHQSNAQGKGLALLPGAKQALSNLDAGTEFTLVVGPEGGLEEHEADWLLNNHYTAVSLGPRILRTETAAVAAISALGSLFGDL